MSETIYKGDTLNLFFEVRYPSILKSVDLEIEDGNERLPHYCDINNNSVSTLIKGEKEGAYIAWFKCLFEDGCQRSFPISYDILQKDLDNKILKSNIEGIEKAKKYINREETPPEGVQVQLGPRGGKFYDTTSYKIIPSDSEETNSLKKYVNMAATSFKRKPPEGYYYASLDNFVNENGKEYQSTFSFTPAEKELIKKLKSSAGPVQKQACFRNSALLAITSKYISGKFVVEYVEGYGLKKGLIPLQHAWITINGKVYDPTWNNEKDIEYFGVPFSPDEVEDMHINKKRTTAGMIDAYELGFPYLKQKREYGKIVKSLEVKKSLEEIIEIINSLEEPEHKKLEASKISKSNAANIESAKGIGNFIGVDWNKVDINEFAAGIEVEKEHASDPETSIIEEDDYNSLGKIALVHLNEDPKYYTKLKEMESDEVLKQFESPASYEDEPVNPEKVEVFGNFKSGESEIKLISKGGKFYITINDIQIRSFNNFSRAIADFYEQIHLLIQGAQKGEDIDFHIFEERIHDQNMKVIPLLRNLGKSFEADKLAEIDSWYSLKNFFKEDFIIKFSSSCKDCRYYRNINKQHACFMEEGEIRNSLVICSYFSKGQMTPAVITGIQPMPDEGTTYSQRDPNAPIPTNAEEEVQRAHPKEQQVIIEKMEIKAKLLQNEAGTVLEKYKKYIGHSESAPKGIQVQVGPHGGRYYETGEKKLAPEEEPEEKYTSRFNSLLSSDPEVSKLTATPIKSSAHLGGGVNDSRVVKYNGDSGVFKPAEGESGNLRESVKPGTYYLREVAAYEVSKTLGFTFVPPTTIRTIDGKIGSIQKWQKGKDGMFINTYFNEQSANDILNMAIFDYIIGNLDRHSFNYLLEGLEKTYEVARWELPKGQNLIIHAIDNGLSFPSNPTFEYKSMFIDVVIEQIDYKELIVSNDMLNNIKNKREEILKIVSAYLDPGAVDETKKRIDRFLKIKKINTELLYGGRE